MTQHVKACGAIVFSRASGRVHYLMLESRKHGHWGPPKGHLDPGETELDAACREVEEETGITNYIPVKGFRHELIYDVIKKSGPVLKKAVYFLWQVPDETVTISPEHRSSAWLTLDEALAVSGQHEDQKELLRAADEAVNNG